MQNVIFAQMAFGKQCDETLYSSEGLMQCMASFIGTCQADWCVFLFVSCTRTFATLILIPSLFPQEPFSFSYLSCLLSPYNSLRDSWVPPIVIYHTLFVFLITDIAGAASLVLGSLYGLMCLLCSIPSVSQESFEIKLSVIWIAGMH